MSALPAQIFFDAPFAVSGLSALNAQFSTQLA